MRVHAISGMHLADMSLVAYPTRNPSGTTVAGGGGGGGEEDRKKIYRIYHPDKTQGRERAVAWRSYCHFARVNFSYTYVCLSLSFPSPFPSPLLRRRKMTLPIIRFVSSHIHIHAHTLRYVTLRTGNAARYFVSASVMNTDKDRSKRVS